MKNSVVSKGRYYEVMKDYNNERKTKVKEIEELREKANKALKVVARCREEGMSDKEPSAKYFTYLDIIKDKEKELTKIKLPDVTIRELAMQADNAPIENNLYDVAMNITNKYKEIIELENEAIRLLRSKIGVTDSPYYWPEWLNKSRWSSSLFMKVIELEKSKGDLRKHNPKYYEKKLNEYLEKKEQERKKIEEVYGDIMKDLE